MTVVTAGVHHAGDLGHAFAGTFQIAGVLLNGKGVGIRPEKNRLATHRPVDKTEQTAAGDTNMPDTHGFHPPGFA